MLILINKSLIDANTLIQTHKSLIVHILNIHLDREVKIRRPFLYLSGPNKSLWRESRISVVSNMDFGFRMIRSQVLAPSLSSYVTLGKSLNISEPWARTQSMLFLLLLVETQYCL